MRRFFCVCLKLHFTYPWPHFASSSRGETSGAKYRLLTLVDNVLKNLQRFSKCLLKQLPRSNSLPLTPPFLGNDVSNATGFCECNTHTIGSWWFGRSNHCCQLKDRRCNQSTVTRLGRKRKSCSCRSKDVQRCSAQLRGLIPESSLQ